MTRRGAGPIERRIRRIGVIALVAGLLATGGAVIWAESPMRAEAGPLAAVRADPSITYRDAGSAVLLIPKQPNGVGLVFIAGARVDAPAYAAKLAGIADAGVTVEIVRPVLNFAIVDTRPLSSFESLSPKVGTWLIGGHSLGGVKACEYATQKGVAGLVLFGSYCANDLSGTSLPVVSIAGSRDGLSTPAKIAAARHLLPASAELDTISGSVHGQFGDYGVQPGDGTPTVSDAVVKAAITKDVLAFLQARGIG